MFTSIKTLGKNEFLFLTMLIRSLFLSVPFLLPIFAAEAHIVKNDVAGFMAGFWHPVFGIDHFLAMLSVGLLSTQIGGKAIWSIPLIFVSMMTIGGVMGFYNIYFPFSEYVLSFSVFSLGLAIAANQKMPLLITMAFVSFFGIFHGYAHGVEMPTIVKAYAYASGFITSTASIHILGVLLGLWLERVKHGVTLLRYLGAAIAGMGIELAILAPNLCF